MRHARVSARAQRARACAEVAAPISGDIPTLDAPQLTSLARTLFVLGERAEFRRVAAIAQGGSRRSRKHRRCRRLF